MKFSLINNIIILCAKRRSGKSLLLRYLVKKSESQYKKIFVICPTEDINKFYQKDGFIPKTNIFKDYNEEWVERLLSTMAKENEGLTEGKDNDKAKKVLLILDDCASDANFHALQSLKKLFTRGRHAFISLILTSQYPNHLPPVCRTNADFICVGQLNEESVKLISDEYRRLLTHQEFNKMYEDTTTDYGFLIINNNSTKSKDINEIYRQIKTPEEFIY
jgi:hypothetical protein